jgi:hypothetical protein
MGVDEAGYGPNLGPLVVSISVWHIPGRSCSADLYEQLADAVSSAISLSTTSYLEGGSRACVTIADSKLVYRPGGGLRELEANLFAVLALLGPLPSTWDELWRRLAPGSLVERDAAPWHAGYQLELPLAADTEDVTERNARLRQCARAASISLVALRSRAVFPARFNHLAERDNSKGSALSALSIELVAEMLSPLAIAADDEPCLVVCDKHGGRNRYGSALQQQFNDVLIRVHGESRDVSTYRFDYDRRPIEVRFQAGGESFLPTALASMASKYLREVSMRAFNHFWCARIPNLRPTAGYPQDARRFKREIEHVQMALGIDDSVLWRTR